MIEPPRSTKELTMLHLQNEKRLYAGLHPTDRRKHNLRILQMTILRDNSGPTIYKNYLPSKLKHMAFVFHLPQ